MEHKNVTYDKHLKYAYIGAFRDNDYDHYSLLFDANTIINFEKFYYSPQAMDPLTLESTKNLLINITGYDIVPGLAITEACWDYNIKAENEGQANKLEKALNDLLNWNKKQIIEHSFTTGKKYEGNVFREKSKLQTTLTDQFQANPLAPGSYACILKIMILQKQNRNNNKLKTIENLFQFMDDELLACLGIEAQLAIYYFLGDPKIKKVVNSILKFGKKNPLLNAWNTCWDLFYLRFLHFGFFDKRVDSINPKLVTNDQGLIKLGALCSLEAVIKTKEGYMPLMSFLEDQIRSEYKKEAKQYLKHLYFGCTERDIKRQGLSDKQKHLNQIIAKLEYELLFSN